MFRNPTQSDNEDISFGVGGFRASTLYCRCCFFFFTVVQGDYLFRLQTVAQATDQSCTSDQARMLDLMKSVSLDKMEKVDQFFEKLLSQTGFTDVREMVDHLMSDELVRALFFVA